MDTLVCKILSIGPDITYFICLTMVLFPDSPAPTNRTKKQVVLLFVFKIATMKSAPGKIWISKQMQSLLKATFPHPHLLSAQPMWSVFLPLIT